MFQWYTRKPRKCPAQRTLAIPDARTDPVATDRFCASRRRLRLLGNYGTTPPLRASIRTPAAPPLSVYVPSACHTCMSCRDHLRPCRHRPPLPAPTAEQHPSLRSPTRMHGTQAAAADGCGRVGHIATWYVIFFVSMMLRVYVRVCLIAL
jgi:hypothetical protein